MDCFKALKGKIKEIDKQDLPEWVVDSFRGGKYKTVITTEDVILYRVFGGNAKSTGAFASTSKSINAIQAKIDNALLPEWKNTRVYEATINVPKGTVLNIGQVAPQKTLSGAILGGGADQVLMPQNWSQNWITNVRILPL
ncbi:hypothetical protein CAPN006_21520 [Capnocytophaga canimorsus]|nr:hypothetical protein CAPN006_21520 [Capnocytophaga canimorsus]